MRWNLKSKKDSQRAWRPDFRVVESLPDTKVVRTNFLFNIIAVTVTVAVLVYVSLQEYNLHGMRDDLERVKSQINEGTGFNRQVLEKNRLWLQQSDQMSEAVRFSEQPVDYFNFLVQVAASRPDGIVYSAITLGYSDERPDKNGKVAASVNLSGKISSGPGSSPAMVLEALQQSLQELPELTGRIRSMRVVQFSRDNDLGVFSFVLDLRVNPRGPSEL